MDRGDWWAAVHGVGKNQTGLSDFHFHQIPHRMLLQSLPDAVCVEIQILNYGPLYRPVQKSRQKPSTCRRCMRQYVLDM